MLVEGGDRFPILDFYATEHSAKFLCHLTYVYMKLVQPEQKKDCESKTYDVSDTTSPVPDCA